MNSFRNLLDPQNNSGGSPGGYERMLGRVRKIVSEPS